MSDSGYNKSIIKPIDRIEAHYRVRAKAAYYPTFVRIYVPNEPYDKLHVGLETQDIPDLIDNPKIPKLETDLERSIRRTRKTIKDLCLCNKFDLFATFTFAYDRHNIDRSKARMATWLKNERRRKGKFEYIIVPEQHKDNALHFHALLQGYGGEVLQSFKENGKPLRQGKRFVYILPSYTHGFTNVKRVDQDDVSVTRVAFYLQKYITKDMPLLFGKNRYWRSKGLRAPVVEDNPEPWYSVIKPTRAYENEYGKILEFDRGSNSLVDMFIEARTHG